MALFWLCLCIYSLPILALRCCSKESHDEILARNSDDSDDSGSDVGEQKQPPAAVEEGDDGDEGNVIGGD